MKKTLALFIACALAPLALGEDLHYTGADGGWLEVANNWTLEDASTHPTVLNTTYNYFIDAGITVVAGNMAGSIANSDGNVVKNSSNQLQFYGFNMTIADGGKLKFTVNDTAPWGSTFNVNGENGLEFACKIWGGYKNSAPTNSLGRTPVVFNLSGAGSVLMSGQLASSNNANMSFTATVVQTAENATGAELAQRVLMTFTAADSSGYFTSLNNLSLDLTASDGSSMVAGSALDSNALSVDDIGKYWLSYEALDGGNYGLVANYVKGVVPEPATATLSLLVLAGLAARRRRK